MTNYEKAKVIADIYGTRTKRQEDLAKDYNMSISRMRIVTQTMGYYHGKLVMDDNLYKGQCFRPYIDKQEIEKKLSFLSDYPDDLFISKK